MASMIMAVTNMILRPFGHPITGSFELMGFGSAIVTGLGLGYSYEKKAHIAVDILFRRFPRTWKNFLSFTGKLASGLFFASVSWKMVAMALNFRESGELSETLCIPFYPVTVLVSMGLFILSLNLLISAFRDSFQRDKGEA